MKELMNGISIEINTESWLQTVGDDIDKALVESVERSTLRPSGVI